MNKVFITGATGFIGRHCLPILLDSGLEVHAAYNTKQLDGFNDVIWHKVDILDTDGTCELINNIKPQMLMHFAWVTEHGKFWTSPENNTWLSASYKLAENFVKNGGTRMVVAGSCAEYDWKYGICSEQLSPILPATLYGACKHGLHLMTRTLCEKNKVKLAWGRIFYLFGPHENKDRFVPYVIDNMLANKPVECKSGSKLLDYMYVEDAARAFVDLLISDFSGALNIASGKPVYIKDMIGIIAEELGYKGKIAYLDSEFTESNPEKLIADNSFLTDYVGWKQQFSLQSALARTIEWQNLNR